MKERRRSFEEIMDVYAFKVMVDSPENCYKAIGAVHSLYKPIEGRFKDYISIPKSNGYQSVHTGVVGENGQPIEVQIKTGEMNEVAENGIASHWLYKAGKVSSDSNPQIKARRWVAGLLEIILIALKISSNQLRLIFFLMKYMSLHQKEKSWRWQLDQLL